MGAETPSFDEEGEELDADDRAQGGADCVEYGREGGGGHVRRDGFVQGFGLRFDVVGQDGGDGVDSYLGEGVEGPGSAGAECMDAGFGIRTVKAC